MDSFCVVDERGEDDDADDEEEDEKHQLVSGRLEGVDEDLEAWRVPGELEKTGDADDAEELQEVVLLLEGGEEEVEVERQGGHKVYRVDGRSHEGHLDWTDHEANE